MSKPANPDHRQQVLAAITLARRPLSATEIAEYLGLDGPSCDTVRDVCNALVATGEARREPGRPARYARAGEGETGS